MHLLNYHHSHELLLLLGVLLLLPKLFPRPANLLVMDEPTNDLDVETLELLEERLINFEGTLLLVSHDRAFLDNVVTSSLVMEGDGRVGDFVGGYSDYLRQRPAPAAPGTSGKPAAKKSTPAAKPAPAKPAATLTTAERKELRELPRTIDKLEKEIAEHEATIGAPGFYDQDPAAVKRATAAHTQAEQALEAAFERWEVLEAKQG